MINLRKKILIIVLFLYPINAHSLIQDGLFATVGNKAITKSEIIEEIKIILIVNGKSYSDENKIQIENAAIKSVIKRKIKEIEIENYNYSVFNEQDIEKELKRITTNLNIDINDLKIIFKNEKINFSSFVNQFITELLWNGLIFQIYKDRLTINLEEIDEQLKIVAEKKDNDVIEYLISEIIINQVNEEEKDSVVKKIMDRIQIEGFESVAINSSISETAVKGGNLGWININGISSKFKSVIINTPVGQMTEPIFLPQGILFFKVRDKKKIKNTVNLEEIKNQLVYGEKTKILNMHSLAHYDKLKRSISINYYQ